MDNANRIVLFDLECLLTELKFIKILILMAFNVCNRGFEEFVELVSAAGIRKSR